MKDLLEIIRDELKDVRIDDGTKHGFDNVCSRLNERLKGTYVYSLGVKDGKERLRNSLKDLLDIQSCDCDK